jgi:hypothetical protein
MYCDMPTRDSFMTVRCPNCGRQFEERIRMLRKFASFRDDVCGAYIETDLNELDKFLGEGAQGVLVLRLSDPER